MPVTTSGNQTIINITTSTPISELDWSDGNYVGRISVDGNWVDMVAVGGLSTPTAIIDGYDLSDSPLGFIYDNGTLVLSASANQRITAIEIYAEPLEAN